MKKAYYWVKGKKNQIHPDASQGRSSCEKSPVQGLGGGCGKQRAPSMGQVWALGDPSSGCGVEVSAQVAEQENRVGLCINTHPPVPGKAKKNPSVCIWTQNQPGLGHVWLYKPQSCGIRTAVNQGEGTLAPSLLPCSGWDGEDAAVPSCCQALGPASGGGHCLGSPSMQSPLPG